jgi:ribosome-associated protein
VSDADLPVRNGLVIPSAELREAASRSGGPGGQHVNKASTRVTLRWNAMESAALTPAQRSRLRRRLGRRLTRSGELVVHARRHRSRARNRELARERLAELVREALAIRRPRRPTRPGRAVRDRTLSAKRRRGSLKRSRAPVHDGD